MAKAIQRLSCCSGCRRGAGHLSRLSAPDCEVCRQTPWPMRRSSSAPEGLQYIRRSRSERAMTAAQVQAPRVSGAFWDNCVNPSILILVANAC
eukprot:365925-Chlamydomonas_euryale.AAC.10